MTFFKKSKKTDEKEIKVALAGNPNVGKSTVFNALTHLNQHTGNWPGKTVECQGGRFSHKSKNFYVVDLPGTYSLLSDSQEEEIARNFLYFEKPDVTVVVVDATCLERNLNLAFQIMEISDNVVLCVNLIDEALKKGIYIDINKLSELLSVPVVTSSAISKTGIDTLKNEIYTLSTVSSYGHYKPFYNAHIENAVSKMENVLDGVENPRFIALKLLDGEINIVN
jgi:ferrous iron transport protein B